MVQQSVRVNNIDIGAGKFTVIAGPCSVESQSQFLEAALAVQAAGACLLRGGVWKLRSSPSSFQGMGVEALPIVREVLQRTKMGFVTEISDIRQIELLEPIASMYQVGARNMHNYALLKELSATRKPILLKRNFSALIDEWIQAAEYLSSGGNQNVILCERGIRTFESKSRFTLDLNAVVWAKQNTHFPVLVDPSHAAGDANLVEGLGLAAAAAGADGLIVEVHPNPNAALSDGKQSQDFSQFQGFMTRLEAVLKALDRPLQTPSF